MQICIFVSSFAKSLINLKHIYMKKILFLLAILPIFVFTACSSDDDENDYSLDGTTWINDEDGLRELKFAKQDFTFRYVYENEEDNDAGTYTYNPPIVSFTAVNRETNKVETQSGTIQGNRLTFGEVVYTKK